MDKIIVTYSIYVLSITVLILVLASTWVGINYFFLQREKDKLSIFLLTIFVGKNYGKFEKSELQKIFNKKSRKIQLIIILFIFMIFVIFGIFHNHNL
jgi:hypothetical protein